MTAVIPDMIGIGPVELARYAATCPDARRVAGVRADRHIRQRRPGGPAVGADRGDRRQRLPDDQQRRAAVLRRLGAQLDRLHW